MSLQTAAEYAKTAADTATDISNQALNYASNVAKDTGEYVKVCFIYKLTKKDIRKAISSALTLCCFLQSVDTIALLNQTEEALLEAKTSKIKGMKDTLQWFSNCLWMLPYQILLSYIRSIQC